MYSITPLVTRLLAACLLAFASQTTLAAASTTKDESWAVNLTFENDLFGNTDRNYTNGVKLSWISPDLTRYRDSQRLPSWSQKWIDKLPFIHQPGLQRNVGLSIGQKIFTPDDIERSDLVKEDRPYAGWLYLSAGFYNKNAYELDTVEVQIGIVGPAAFGEEGQNQIHRWRDIPLAKGWDNQLDNELGVNLIYEHKRRAIRQYFDNGLGWDAIHHVGAAIGNVYTYANLGTEVRFGYNLPTDFGVSLIRPGGDAFAASDSSDPRYANSETFSLHGFLGVTGRAVARDIFLDGNTFEDSHSVDKEYLVGSVLGGVSLIVGSMKISYAQVFTSKEFRNQDSGHNFGSLSLSYTY